MIKKIAGIIFLIYLIFFVAMAYILFREANGYMPGYFLAAIPAIMAIVTFIFLVYIIAR